MMWQGAEGSAGTGAARPAGRSSASGAATPAAGSVSACRRGQPVTEPSAPATRGSRTPKAPANARET